MRCYRIENRLDKKGVFQGNARNDYNYDIIVDNHRCMDNPYYDPILCDIFTNAFICAYNSLSELKKWTKGVNFEWLKDNGFSVYAVDCSILYRGEDQCIFEPCKIVMKKDISKLF